MNNKEVEQFMEWVKARVPEPKREWVGLTEEEKDRITSLTAAFGRLSAINLTEKFLKEKNNG